MCFCFCGFVGALQGYVSIGCEPCTRPVLPWQHEREGRWWWEDAKSKECGLHKGNVREDEAAPKTGNGAGPAAADLFDAPGIVNLSRPGIENLLKIGGRKEPWIVVLYAPWCGFCQVSAFHPCHPSSRFSAEILNRYLLPCRGSGNGGLLRGAGAEARWFRHQGGQIPGGR